MLSVLSVCLCAIFVNFTLLFLSLHPLPLVSSILVTRTARTLTQSFTLFAKKKKKKIADSTNKFSFKGFFFLFYPFLSPSSPRILFIYPHFYNHPHSLSIQKTNTQTNTTINKNTTQAQLSQFN